jgi:hypothetical protein
MFHYCINAIKMPACSAVSDTEKLKDLLQFATGRRSIPVNGFIPQPTLAFKHLPGLGTDFFVAAEMTPTANTCALQLQLPVVPSEEVFRTVMEASLCFNDLFTTQ